MKKALKYLGLFAVLACLCLSLTACGGVTGTYKSTTELAGVKTERIIKLKSGDKCEMIEKTTKNGKTEESSAEGTYKIDGEKITITIEGAPLIGTIKDGKITIGLWVFEK